MAYNYRYESNKENGHGTTEMTDIPNIRSKINYAKDSKADHSRSVSPSKYGTGPSGAMSSSDVVTMNEKKVRDNIKFANNSGSIGPYLKFDQTTPSPKVPKVGAPATSYASNFSPGKSREPAKLSLNDSYISKRSNGNPSMGLRHMANGDAMYGRGPLNSSIDFKSPGSNKPIYAKSMNLDKTDDFRFKKNLTTNADRILGKPGAPAYSPMISNSSKFDELKRSPHGYDTDANNYKKPEMQHYRTINNVGVQENYNSNNIVKPHSHRSKHAEPAGGYNAAHLKRTMGLAPTDAINYSPSLKPGMSPTISTKKMVTNIVTGVTLKEDLGRTSVPTLNDPSFHRHKNFNSYGFDTINGVQKGSTYREL
uniref:Uncharacterized protein n=1 Tax=Euplotes crassus TaxID=5936 RepID=A0A7S3KRJ2_EUPCR|mmetsp:Transcript_38112/g.37622  ORF Transcript_38112/g.37622 Transcript_38112/m.37622 type:complete len:366 (+) Transcript_38112:27-1124(+)